MDNNNQNNKKINKILIITVFLLIVIIVLLLLKGCSNDNIDKKDNDSNSSEGKINVFEIKCDCSCEESEDKSADATNQTFQENDSTTEIDIKVIDENKTWDDTTKIDIFSDSSYTVKGKIAPESTGTYQFIIKNSTSYKIKYSIEFNETNNYKINMKYRLKKNNKYVISDWVTYSKLKQEKIKLDAKSSDTYYLEWKWFESSNDNSIGEDINSKYGLSINIKAVQAND